MVRGRIQVGEEEERDRTGKDGKPAVEEECKSRGSGRCKERVSEGERGTKRTIHFIFIYVGI